MDQPVKESAWGWCVVVACAFCFGTCIAFENDYSLFYNEFINVYNTTANVVTYSAWIGSTSSSFIGFFCILSSILVDIFNERKVAILGGILSTIGLLTSGFVSKLKLYFLTYGFVFGLGQSLLFESSMAILPHYFNKRLGLANGLMNFGGSVLTIALSFGLEESFKKLGLSKYFFILSGLLFLNTIFVLSFKPKLKKDDQENNLTPLKRIKHALGLRIWRSRKFQVWIMSAVIFVFGYLIPVFTIVHFSELKFHENSNPSLIAALLGALSGISSILFGKLRDYKKFPIIYYHVACFLLCGIVQITLPFLDQFYQLCIMVSFLGIVDGLLFSFVVPISSEIAESPRLCNQAIGYFFMALVPTQLTGPIIAGILYEKYNTYSYAYYVGGGSCILGGMLLLFLYPDGFFIRIFKTFIHKRLYDFQKENSTYGNSNSDIII